MYLFIIFALFGLLSVLITESLCVYQKRNSAKMSSDYSNPNFCKIKLNWMLFWKRAAEGSFPDLVGQGYLLNTSMCLCAYTVCYGGKQPYLLCFC